MTELIDEMQEDATATAKEGAPNETVIQLAEEMADLRDEKKRLKAELKDVNDRYDEIRKELLPEAMNAAGMVTDAGKGSFTTASGLKVHLRSTVKSYVRKADKPAFFRWLEENGHGDLVKPTVHYQTLNAWVREQRGQGSDLPPEVNTHDETKAVIRRS